MGTPVTDPVERAARIIARRDLPHLEWDDITGRNQEYYRVTARTVLSDYIGSRDPHGEIERVAGMTDSVAFGEQV